MLIGSLHRTGLFLVVEDEERADAFVRGAAEDLIYSDSYRRLRRAQRTRVGFVERAAGRRVRIQRLKLRGSVLPNLAPIVKGSTKLWPRSAWFCATER